MDPIRIVVDREVASVRAEDATGSFGILDRHADFLTVLEASVISWREPDGTAGDCAVRNGVLSASEGRDVAIATREAHVGNVLDRLEAEMLVHYRKEREAERMTRAASAKARMRAIRAMVEALQGSPRAIGP